MCRRSCSHLVFDICLNFMDYYLLLIFKNHFVFVKIKMQFTIEYAFLKRDIKFNFINFCG